MREYTSKGVLRNIVSVVAGVVTGFAILSLLNMVLVLFFLPGNRDSESAENSSLFKVLAVVTVVISCLVAGFVTAKISTRKTFIHVFLTGIVLLLVILAIGDFRWKEFSITDWAGLLLAVPSTMIGGYRSIKGEIVRT